MRINDIITIPHPIVAVLIKKVSVWEMFPACLSYFQDVLEEIKSGLFQ